MRRFPKLLAVVLAIAIIICPAMCLTSMAETTNAYDVQFADNQVTITIDADFLVALLKLDVEGYSIDESKITVTTTPAYSFSANPDFDAENGVLKLLVAAKEAANIAMVSSATITIPVTEVEDATRFYIALTNIQAADAGTADAPESFLDFDGVDTATGAVETVDPVVDSAAHTHEYLTYTYVDADTHTVYCECTDEQTVAHVYADGVCPCGAIEPNANAKGFEYSKITYDSVANAFSIYRSAPLSDLSAANSAAKEAGNRWRGLKVVVGGKENLFKMDYTTGAGSFKVTGLAFTDMEQELLVSYLITADGGFSYETDVVEIKAFELLEAMKGNDEKTAKMLDLYEVSKTADPVTVTPKAVGTTAGFEFGEVTFNFAECTAKIARSAPLSDLTAANSAAKEAGNRWRGLRVVVGEKEYLFKMDYTTGAGSFNVTGLALTDISEDITVSYLITADGNFRYETGSVTIAIGDAIAASTGDLANAYNAYVG